MGYNLVTQILRLCLKMVELGDLLAELQVFSWERNLRKYLIFKQIHIQSVQIVSYMYCMYTVDRSINVHDMYT